jgi:hypothetical protein
MKQETEQQDAASTGGKANWKGPWTRRISGPVQYVRYTDWVKHSGGVPGSGVRAIHFAFDLPPGQDRLPEPIYAVMKEHQTFGDGQPSGLRSKKGGKLWSLVDSEKTRALADRIDMALKELA